MARNRNDPFRAARSGFMDKNGEPFGQMHAAGANLLGQVEVRAGQEQQPAPFADLHQSLRAQRPLWRLIVPQDHRRVFRQRFGDRFCVRAAHGVCHERQRPVPGMRAVRIEAARGLC